MIERDRKTGRREDSSEKEGWTINGFLKKGTGGGWRGERKRGEDETEDERV